MVAPWFLHSDRNRLSRSKLAWREERTISHALWILMETSDQIAQVFVPKLQTTYLPSCHNLIICKYLICQLINKLVKTEIHLKKKKKHALNSASLGTPLAVQWLGLYAFTAEGTGSIPGRGIKIPQVALSPQILLFWIKMKFFKKLKKFFWLSNSTSKY